MKTYKSEFYGPSQWNEEAIRKSLNDGWAIYRIWEYGSETVRGNLVTFIKFTPEIINVEYQVSPFLKDIGDTKL